MHRFAYFLTILTILAACTDSITQYNQADPLAIATEQWRQDAALNEGSLGKTFKGANFTDPKNTAAERAIYVAGRILTAAAPLCGENIRKDYLFGLRAIPQQQPKISVPLAIKALGEQNDILFDDRLVSIDRIPLTTGPLALKQTEAVLNSALRENRPITLNLERGHSNEPLAVRIIPATRCAYGVRVVPSKVVNAFADGDRITFNSALINILENDHELAAVAGHELAHNILQHPQHSTANRSLGALGGLMLDVLLQSQGIPTDNSFSKVSGEVTAQTFTPDQEREADYVGLYLMYYGGFDPNAAISTLEKLAVTFPEAIHLNTDHPNMGERVANLRIDITEIYRKAANGQPIFPDPYGTRKAAN